jgi:putative phosphoribosyl transferase
MKLRSHSVRVDKPIRSVEVSIGQPGSLAVPEAARGIVLFAHGSGSSRFSPRNNFVAGELRGAGIATLLFDLLSEAEAADRANVFDIALLAERLLGATDWVHRQPGIGRLPIGYFGASTGAGAALVAAAAPGNEIAAIVSRGGRPDMAGASLTAVRAPTLLIVGGEDIEVLALNRQAQRQLHCEHRLEVVPGATHLFEEPGTLERVVELARDWFMVHLTPGNRSHVVR